MTDPKHNDQNPSEELEGSLRRAVEAVRRQPMPEEALAKSLDKAASMPPPKTRPFPFWRRREFLAVAGLAAALLVAIGIWGWPGRTEKNSEVAFNKGASADTDGFVVNVKMDTAAAGFITPGSRVDVIATETTPDGRKVAKIIMQNVPVQAVSGNDGDKTAVKLQVDPAEAEKLARDQTNLTLSLRTPGNTVRVETFGASDRTSEDTQQFAASSRPHSKSPAPTSPAPPPPTGAMQPRIPRPGEPDADGSFRQFNDMSYSPNKDNLGGGYGLQGGPLRGPGGRSGDWGPNRNGGPDRLITGWTPAGSGDAKAKPGGKQGGTAIGNLTPDLDLRQQGQTIAGSPIMTLADTKNLAAGMTVTGTGVPANTTVTAIGANTVTLSAACTATNTGPLSFTGNYGFSGQTTTGSTLITGLDTSKLTTGMYVAGPGIPVGTKIRAIKGKEIELNKSASTTSKIPLTFTKEKTPEVWKRDQKRPSFARVYVGNGNSLELVSEHVTVIIDGPRARTVVDHIFHNPHAQQLEGTFEYPLPTGASASYFAMFLGQTRDTVPARFVRRGGNEVAALPPGANAPGSPLMTPDQLVKHVSTDDWGRLQEARIVGKQKALETYEEIVRGRIDPALLEYAGGNTFRGRVFPIPAKAYNRVIIAYEELLPMSQGNALYRFPLPDCKLSDVQFTLQASSADCKNVVFKPEDAKKQEGGGQLLYSRSWKDKGPGGDVLFTHTPVLPKLQAISGKQGDGPLYVYARVRPELESQKTKPFAEHAVFLLDTSLSEHPDRFAINMKLLEKVLATDDSIKHFNILAFNVGSAWVEPKGWLENSKAGREKALDRLDGIVLEGATDIGAALDKLATADLPKDTPVEVFLLSDGQITWGEPDVGPLVSRFEGRSAFKTRFNCYRTGIGADNLELYEALTRRGGGIFNCFTEGDLDSAAAAHRQQCLQIDNVRFVGGPAATDVLVAGRKGAVYPGGELIVAGRMAATGKTQLVVEGTYMGQKVVEEYPIEVKATSELAPRGWGEVAVASLLALNDSKLDELVTAYCQQFGIGSRAASFLVLENADDYKRLNLEEERGKTVPGGDMGKFLGEMWQKMGKVTSAREAFNRFLAQIEPKVKLKTGAEAPHVKKLLELLAESDFELPSAPLAGAILKTRDVPPTYLAARDADPRNVETYLTESQRRAGAKDTEGAIRVLSTIIEEHPERGDALRLVGYRLIDLKQPIHAVRLFDRVQRQRPFEPHSYIDLARSLEESGKFGLAAVQYEIVLAGTWHNRFHESLKVLAREEYARMMRQAIQAKALKPDLANHFGDRIEKMDSKQFQSDLRVSITWNTDATDVDLWVIEPDGTKCFYSHNRTKNGGELSQDQTQGYGPERYQVKQAMKGEYTIIVHYYRPNPNQLAGESHVNVVVTRNAGTPQEKIERRTVILKQNNEQVEVTRVKF